MKLGVLFILVCILNFSCRKREEKVQALATISIGKNIRLNDIKILSDTTWIACGGHRDIEGHIFRSTDAGATWTVYSSEFPKSIYCLDFPTPEIGMAGGDFLHLWQTTDGGATWSFLWLADQVPVNGEDRPAVRDISMISPIDWCFCGGENLGEGVIYETHDGGDNWSFSFQQHELRAIEHLDEANYIVAGHGASYAFQQSLATLVQTNFENDFITSCVKLDNVECVAVSYSGAIYRTTDLGQSWSEIVKSNQFWGGQVAWNDVTWNGSKLVAAGNDGHFALSTDGGYTWTAYQLENEPNLYGIAFSYDAVWATSDNGKIYRIQ